MYQPKLEKELRCPLEYGLHIFDGKWKVRIICALYEIGNLRYGQLKKKMGTKQLVFCAAAIALVLAFRNYQVRWHVIAHSTNKSVYLAIDIVTLVLCIIVKLLVSGNFDVSYLLLVIAYFVTKRRYRKELEEQLPS